MSTPEVSMNSMRKIALLTIGTRGDVQPVLALALALKKRGHQVRVGAPPDFGAWITAQDVAFTPVGVDIKQYLADNPDLFTGSPRGSLGAAKKFFAQEVPAHARTMAPLCEWADVVVWGGLALVAQHLAERSRRPVLGLIFSPCMLPSKRHAPASLPHHGLPGWINGMLWLLSQMATNHIAGRPVNAMRAEWGLPVVNLRKFTLEHDRLFVAADAQLFPHDPHWPSTTTGGSFIFYDDPQPLDPSLGEWLADGDPPVWIGFGSMAGDNTRRVETLVIDAMKHLGTRCLIGAGWAGLGERDLPSGWRVVREAPHPKLFPRVAAVVHHGGSGTTANALRAGAPQLILPLILDQYYHAHCLHRAGMMPKPISMEKITARQLAEGIRWVTEHGREAREAAALRLLHSDACTDIARQIEAMDQVVAT